MMLVDLELTGTTLNTINGLMMTLAFFIVRVCFYAYTSCYKVFQHCYLNYTTFWARYEDHKIPFCWICVVLYLSMYGLQLFWFRKMVLGCLKALGFIKKSKKRVDGDKGKQE